MIADAPELPGAAGTTARLVLAVAASALLHAALLAGADTLAGIRPVAGLAFDPAGRSVLHTSLRPVAAHTVPGAGKPAPDARPATGAAADATAAGTGLLPAPLYHRAEELDQRPQIRVQVEPQLPAPALAPSGRTVLRLYVNEAGEVDEIAVESADAAGAFVEAARAAFAAARFYPGIKDGVPVRSLIRIEVLFGLPPPPRIADTSR